jgi:uncharacterized protein YaiL (DUF2058 family)
MSYFYSKREILIKAGLHKPKEKKKKTQEEKTENADDRNAYSDGFLLS